MGKHATAAERGLLGVNEVLKCSAIGVRLIVCYLNSSGLSQLAQLASLWDSDRNHMIAPSWSYSMDCSVVIENNTLIFIENNTLIFEVALPSLTVRYDESVRQALITQLLELRWLGTAILNKGVLPATSVQTLGHIVVDYEPAGYNRPPTLTNKMVPDYEDIPITVHNLYMKHMLS